MFFKSNGLHENISTNWGLQNCSTLKTADTKFLLYKKINPSAPQWGKLPSPDQRRMGRQSIGETLQPSSQSLQVHANTPKRQTGYFITILLKTRIFHGIPKKVLGLWTRASPKHGVMDTRVPQTWGFKLATWGENCGLQTCAQEGGRSEVWVDTTSAKADADEQRRGKRSQGTTGVFQTWISFHECFD